VAVTEAHPETKELAVLLTQQERLAARVDEIGAEERAEQLAAEARKLVEQDGEQAPTVLVRLGQPRHAQVTPEAVPA
jgi:hypothetical protein